MRCCYVVVLFGLLIAAVRAKEPEVLSDRVIKESASSDDNGDGCCECAEAESCYSYVGPLRQWNRRHAGRADLFHESPLGFHMHEALLAQVRQGFLQQLVLYEYDFLVGRNPDHLSPRGQHQVRKFAQLMLETGAGPLVIEASSDPALDEARRVEALLTLKSLEVAFPDNFVVVGRPKAIGLRGDDAGLIHANQLLQTNLRGRLMRPIDGGSGTNGR